MKKSTWVCLTILVCWLSLMAVGTFAIYKFGNVTVRKEVVINGGGKQ